MKSKKWIENSQKEIFTGIRQIELRLELSSQPNTQNGGISHPNNNQPAFRFNPEDSALGTLCQALKLSNFERQTLLLVAGSEISANLRESIGEAQEDETKAFPTFDLAFDLFTPERKEKYLAISEHGKLRNWELVRFRANDDNSRQFRALEMDENILNYLLGYSQIDKRLEEYISPVEGAFTLPQNIKSFKDITFGIARAVENTSARFPFLQLSGSSYNLKRQILHSALQPLGFELYELPWILLPKDFAELQRISQLWMRETTLEKCVLLLNCDSIGKSDHSELNSLHKFLVATNAPIAISSREGLPLAEMQAINFEVSPLIYEEQYQLWQQRIGTNNSDVREKIESIVANFRLTPQEIDHAVNTSSATAKNYDELYDNLWKTCRARARPKLDELAQRIEPSAGWSDLILPNDRKEMLREMISQVRHRTQVFQRWNFGKKKESGVGSVCFVCRH